MKKKKILLTVLIVIVSLALAAVLFGVLNATVGKGQWSLGWQDYRYDGADSFALGSGTVYEADIRAIEIDWTKGDVELILSEDDRYLSITEQAQEELSNSAMLRWRVDENGTLTVKFRESGYFFTVGMQEKRLTVRVPAAISEQLTSVRINGGTKTVSVRDLKAESLEINSQRADLRIENLRAVSVTLATEGGSAKVLGGQSDHFSFVGKSGTLEWSPTVLPAKTTLETGKGGMLLILPTDSDFTLSFETKSGALTSDFPLTQQNGVQIHGTGEALLEIKTVGGTVRLQKQTQ